VAGQCPIDFYVLNAEAKGLSPAYFVVAVAKGRSPVSQSATARSATEPANVVAMFVAVLAKLTQSHVQRQHDINCIRATPLISSKFLSLCVNIS
jgi:hypothetical protein